MNTITVEAEVDVDVSSVICEITTADLVAELAGRGVDNYSDRGQQVLFEELYYALRDGDIDKAIAVINPLIEDVIGRKI